MHLHRHIAFIAPPSTFHNKPYVGFLSTSDFDEDITIAVSFRDEVAGYKIHEGQQSSQNVLVQFVNGGKTYKGTTKKNKKSVNGHPLNVLVRKDGQCVSNEVLIAHVEQESHVFIQLDKPIYNPMDEVKFRVIVFDGDTKGIGINNINVTIEDATGNLMETYTKLKGEQFISKGLYENTFSIAEQVNLGYWKISAKINNNARIYAGKNFLVNKIEIPFYELKLNVPEVVYRDDKKFDVEIYGFYRFGEYAKGSAKITVENYQNPSRPTVLFSDNIKIDSKVIKTLRIREDLKIMHFASPFATLKIDIVFHDDATRTKQHNSKFVKVYQKKEHQIIIKKPFPYTPGLNFKIDVLIKDWNGRTISSSTTPVIVNCYIKRNGFFATNGVITGYLSNNVASFEIETISEVKEMVLEVKYAQSNQTERIREDIQVTDSLRVFVKPER